MKLLSALPKLTGVVSGVAIAACVVQSQPPAGGPTAPHPSNQGDGEYASGDQVVPNGQYSCTIDDYQPFLCQVYTNPDGSQTLEKMGGSQRFRGQIAAADGGFDFDGVFFCPHGDCTRDVQASFEALDDGAFQGVLDSGDGRPMNVALMYMPGGMGYGGIGYGGIGYGIYGGAAYTSGSGRF
jgi:hypothetical protein